MKKIDIDDELYQYIASNTQSIGESASTILRRLLNLSDGANAPVETTTKTEQEHPVVEVKEEAKQESSLEPSDENVDEAAETVTASTQVKGNVFNVLNKEELAMQKGVVGRFLFILAALYRTHKKDFANVLEIKGRDRVYFATSKEALLESGSSMNPKNITDTEYWVMTNSNTTRKKMMLHEVALCLGYSADEAEKIRDYL
ncbi:replication initiation negative regulator SeqA [Pseudoalteromonas shioyasakiensis]|uniref:replication initiation negative regulator SeqA n=1 Tax=Pseudoalteromonas TaxID=53246 RepID=UPI000C8E28C0|nr:MULTISPECIES: replication initiation negative regulator SeqA [Pseudoalteromonas]MAD02895.1 replication initiation negative regulator SeqA [Pseudoalteromonas sp.]MCG9710923.1 replication initiation negative regulator SeqA [Pseudoalteromonas sp. Isolate3]MCP4588155.1 replication initiation negative regulator SeqA [Pseudoalteromonas sp.]MCQ8881508.1 replication initiation negative regulator SeqA [Pseudoalteromonas shioyasakiensis]NIZ04731.1 replication initiation negative regulator SeqA [Pseud|tara:strand:- start:26880 stop:27482 length:603 start_codon:yes stop_codon:yes gene_type:complete